LFGPGALLVEVSMVVDRDYMLKQPSGPSAPKLFLDTKLVPAAVNMLGAMEVALERASARTGVGTARLLAGVAGLGALGIGVLLFRAGAKPVRPAPPEPDRLP
jgi:hypothetical protein